MMPPQRDIDLPLLKALVHLGGAAPARDVYEEVEKFFPLGHGFFNNKNLESEFYGKVTVYPSGSEMSSSHWACDAAASIPQMVITFFQAHLQPKGNQA